MEATITERETLRRFGLNWTVDALPLVAVDSDTPFELSREITSHRGLYRSDRGEWTQPLSIVGPQYQIRQNFEHLRALTDILGPGSQEKIHHAGHFGRGQRVFFQAKISDGGVGRGRHREPVDNLLTGISSHGGGLATVYGRNANAIWCSNTLLMVYSLFRNRVHHTRSQNERIDVITAQLRSEIHEFEADLEEFNFWARSPVTNQQINKFLEELFPSREKILEEIDPVTLEKEVKIIRPRARDDVRRVYETGRGMANREHTWWRAFNAVTEYVDHHRRTKRDASRLESSWTGSGGKLREQAMTLIRSQLN